MRALRFHCAPAIVEHSVGRSGIVERSLSQPVGRPVIREWALVRMTNRFAIKPEGAARATGR